MRQRKHIVCIGGGTGMPRVLQALKDHDVHLSAIVTMADSGGSTGLLRKHYGTLPTGDVRRALAVLATTASPLKDLMRHRFRGGPLDQQSAGSIFLTSLEKVTGSFEQAIEAASELLKVRGEVIPVTLDNVHLCARLANGDVIREEANIDVPKEGTRTRISEVWLEPDAVINLKARQAIEKADMVIIGPGDLYTSLIPNLLVRGVPEAMKASEAKKVFIANLMTKFGETQNFTTGDFVREIERYVPLDAVLWNTKRPDEKLLKIYRAAHAEFVVPPSIDPRTSDGSAAYVFADIIADRDGIRHDAGEKLARALLSLLD